MTEGYNDQRLASAEEWLASNACPAQSGKPCKYNCDDSCLLLPVVWEAQHRAFEQARRDEILKPVREAHDWGCDCTPDDPCRILIALNGGPARPERDS